MGRLGTHAVYASSGGSPRQDARLASGCWPDSTGWAQGPLGSSERFPSMLLTSLSPFPRLTLAQARVGPAHRLQRLPQARSRPDQVQCYYILLLSERMSPLTHERIHDRITIR